ncbi:hypothetical protein DD238_007811 [Peronospora effusa]|uniref:Transcription and mRNA export factor ENY2 n=1 Tax=Peronospora effusa TaxID=542832 RepID=A0A3M6VPX9_9STRA|nr:hypothetical protein DD238_007811 [Peronospora effusa]
MDVDCQQMDEEVKMRIGKRFVQSGEKEKLKEFLRLKLVECGWCDAMKQHMQRSSSLVGGILDISREHFEKLIVVIRKKGIDHVTVEDLVEEITLEGRALVPEDVKNEILEKIN